MNTFEFLQATLFLKSIRFLFIYNKIHLDSVNSYPELFFFSFSFFHYVLGLKTLYFRGTSIFTSDINRRPTRWFATSFALVYIIIKIVFLLIFFKCVNSEIIRPIFTKFTGLIKHQMYLRFKNFELMTSLLVWVL